MNDREKKLTFMLLTAILLIGTAFLYTSYDAAKKKNMATFTRNTEELERMKNDLFEAEDKIDNEEWLSKNPPIESSFGAVSAELASFIEKSAVKNGVSIKKRPSPVNADPEEFGAYRSAVVIVTGNAVDSQLYRWLVDIQSPDDHRSITLLRISPQRDDNTKADCQLEVSQWFSPLVDETVTSN